jgi:hypothetical protein
VGCASVKAGGGHQVARDANGRRVLAAELQQEIERLASRFVERMNDAVRVHESNGSPALRQAFLARSLSYNSAALEIATGSDPLVNLLDMLVFVTLSRSAFERHWIPQLFGPEGEPIDRALAAAESDAWRLGDRILNQEQRGQLHLLIDAFVAHYPDQAHVEGVRLEQFSQLAATAAERRSARGLLATLKTGAKTADAAVLLGERAVFVAQRAPALMRLQARLGVQEVLGDTLERLNTPPSVLKDQEDLLRRSARMLDQLQGVLQDVRTLQPVLDQATALTASAERATAEARALSRDTVAIIGRIEEVVRTGGAEDAWRAVMSRWDALLRRAVAYVVAAGLTLSAAFWAGYYLVQRALSAHRDRSRA